jgi:hypothetical protein
MISRLTTFAALFAVLAIASLSFAASAQHPSANAAAAAKPVHVVQLERVIVVGKRI